MGFKYEYEKKVPTNTRIDPLPCVSTVKTPEIPHRITLTECSWPFLCSIALHAVLFEILFFPALKTPIVATSQDPTILWFTPFVVPGNSGHMTEIQNQPVAAFTQETNVTGSDNATEPLPNVSSEVVTVAGDRPSPLPTPVASTDAKIDNDPATADAIVIQAPKKVRFAADRHLLDPTPAPRQAITLSAPLVSRNTVPPSTPESLRKEQQALSSQQAGIYRVEQQQFKKVLVERQDKEARLARELVAQEQVRAERALREQLTREQARQALREQAERERAAAEKTQQEQEGEKLQQERMVQEEQERLAAEQTLQSQRAREQAQQAQAIREQSERERAAAEKIRHEQEVLKKLRQERKLQEDQVNRKKMEQPLELTRRRQLAVAVKHQEPLASAITENHAGKPALQQPQKGLVLPFLKGDLKLVVTGTALPKETITFKEFALSRRSRPFSRVEARHEITIIPLTANTQENTHEIVIGKVNPGVYSITIEPVDGPTDVIFSLKLYEGTSRMIVKNLGRRTLTRKFVLLKVLMPEGILWDDNAAFTGNMEDSDGVTKFNSGTGLMWKEYAD